MTAPALRAMATFLCMTLAVVALVTYRTEQQGAALMAQSDRAFDAGQLEVSVRHARRAATLYVPGATHVARGYARLRAVALGAERSRDVELALTAWRALRAAAIETRHVFQPNAAELHEANASLARLMGAPPPAPSSREAGVMSAGSVLVAVSGFACAVFAALLLCFGGATRAARWAPQRVVIPALLLAAGMISLSLALISA